MYYSVAVRNHIAVIMLVDLSVLYSSSSVYISASVPGGVLMIQVFSITRNQMWGDTFSVLVLAQDRLGY